MNTEGAGVRRQKSRVKERRSMVEHESVEENHTSAEIEQITRNTHLN